MKIYVVTSGFYSDYHIEKVFLDYNKAKTYVNSYKWMDDVRIESHEVADDDIEIGKISVRRVTSTATIQIHVSGELTNSKIINTTMIEKGYKSDFSPSVSINYTGASRSKNYIEYSLSVERFLESDKYSEKDALDKAQRITEDYITIIKNMIAEGANIVLIQDALNENEMNIEDLQ